MQSVHPVSRVLPGAAAMLAVVMLLPSGVEAHGRTPLRIVALDAPAEAPPSQRIIVKFRDGTPEHRQRALATQHIATFAGTTLGVEARVVSRLAMGADVVRFSAPLARGEAEAIAREIARDPSVEYAEADRHVQRATEPDDPWYSGPITFGDTTYTKFQADLYDAKGGIAAPGAWAQGAQGKGIVVAVLDTGITAHPDLDDNVVPGAGHDFVTDPFFSGREAPGRVPGAWDTGDWTNAPPWSTAGCRVSASSWHGTHVAGTIAAVTNNGIGIAGIAGDAKLLPVRVLGHCGGQLSDIADAVVWASGGTVEGVPANATPAHVINMSLGGGGSCPAYMQSAIDQAVARGTTIVVAAGNANTDSIGATPANCRNVVTVASTGLTGKRASYSNYGTPVDIAAPGGGRYVNDASSGTQWVPGGYIWSTHNTGSTGPGDASYAGMAGTSMAAPHVAGIVALMQGAAASHLMPDIVERYLAGTSRTFPLAPDRAIGAGIANADAAVAAVMAGAIPPPPPMRVASGQLIPKLTAFPGQAHGFVIDVPEGASRLTLRSFGGTGDADMFVKFGKPAGSAHGQHDVAAIRPGNNATVTLQWPRAGQHFVLLDPARPYDAVYFQATVQ